MRIAALDDDALQLELIQRATATMGHMCHTYQSGAALLKALQSRKWADFARLYNGPAYKENLYDVKLARAYEQLSATYKTAELQPEEESTNA